MIAFRFAVISLLTVSIGISQVAQAVHSSKGSQELRQTGRISLRPEQSQ